LRTAFQELGAASRRQAPERHANLALGDHAIRLLEGSRRVILPEPETLLTTTPKVPGLDGQKMSKSYGNAILMREEPAELTKKIRTMQTDPARMRRSDKGDPARCPVWPLHQIYSDQARRYWVWKGCTTAGIGCLDCKQPVIDAIIAEQVPIRERAQRYLDDPQVVRNIVADGCERARKLAEETMRDVRARHGLITHAGRPSAIWRNRAVPRSRAFMASRCSSCRTTCTSRRRRWRSFWRPSRAPSTSCST
jgi:tryptophanyl-tRNA synthetase